MTPKRTSSVLQKLRLKTNSSRPTSQALSTADTAFDSNATPISETGLNSVQSAPTDSMTDLFDTNQSEKSSRLALITESNVDTVATTNSSPVDPMYKPKEDGTGGTFVRSPKSPKSLPKTPIDAMVLARRSFFETDTESEDESPVLGRASSVRISKPSVVEQSPVVRGRSVRMCESSLTTTSRQSSPSSSYSVERLDTVLAEVEYPGRTGPEKALAILEGDISETFSSTEPFPTYTEEKPNMSVGELAEKIKNGGLFMNPVTTAEKIRIHRTISAPPIPQRNYSQRRVRIRPSDLVLGNVRNNSRPFRESIVTTPYPLLHEEDEDVIEKEASSIDTSTIPSSAPTTGKSSRFESDRFPSPDRSEILFLDLGLAGRPAATTMLEIRIADKNTFDDEMLFRQIRASYRGRLLGLSRSPFQLIRGVTHATVTPSIEFDFRSSNFMKHFNDPRIGRRRKTWAIWLRHHSRLQHYPVKSSPSCIEKRPLSASLRTADKRLSMHSDSSSSLNLSFLPPLSIPRIPFFKKSMPSQFPVSPSACRSAVMFGNEVGYSSTVKIELHHEFSFWMLAFLFLWIMTLSVAAVVLWTIFGVPGSRPSWNSDFKMPASLLNEWNAAAQTRVLTGLVLGLMVALLGTMMEICLIAGAYILL